MFFVAAGVSETSVDRYELFFSEGITGLLSATGLVFVSYAGVTSIASIAEEVKRPARTIPRAMIASILFMVVLYPLLVAVMVGVTSPDNLAESVTPVATAAGQAVGVGFADVIAVVAILALISMANAGLLASSRLSVCDGTQWPGSRCLGQDQCPHAHAGSRHCPDWRASSCLDRRGAAG